MYKVVTKCLHLVKSYMKQNKTPKQTLNSAQYGLEIILKSLWSVSFLMARYRFDYSDILINPHALRVETEWLLEGYQLSFFTLAEMIICPKLLTAPGNEPRPDQPQNH